eukprot:TRINITY_DN2398_c5_g1_i1.p2 TRINITY_DN2398_c5_g1~~TRINITY_DN2398_c5_g1_i1.p2  ORF type:complete len:506 (+),score=96.50 TRINITY_DN2398_c5_g1_i1:80-1519(+)
MTTGKWYDGTCKFTDTTGAEPFGFVQCDELKRLFGKDAFCGAEQANHMRIGEQVRFTVRVCGGGSKVLAWEVVPCGGTYAGQVFRQKLCKYGDECVRGDHCYFSHPRDHVSDGATSVAVVQGPPEPEACELQCPECNNVIDVAQVAVGDTACPSCQAGIHITEEMMAQASGSAPPQQQQQPPPPQRQAPTPPPPPPRAPPRRPQQQQVSMPLAPLRPAPPRHQGPPPQQSGNAGHAAAAAAALGVWLGPMIGAGDLHGATNAVLDTVASIAGDRQQDVRSAAALWAVNSQAAPAGRGAAVQPAPPVQPPGRGAPKPHSGYSPYSADAAPAGALAVKGGGKGDWGGNGKGDWGGKGKKGGKGDMSGMLAMQNTWVDCIIKRIAPSKRGEGVFGFATSHQVHQTFGNDIYLDDPQARAVTEGHQVRCLITGGVYGKPLIAVELIPQDGPNAGQTILRRTCQKGSACTRADCHFSHPADHGV